MPEPIYQPLNFQAFPGAGDAAPLRRIPCHDGTAAHVRDYSDRPVPREIIENALRTAALAPSGANQQPWTFVCISDAAIKMRIRAAAEEERAFYEGRAGAEWLSCAIWHRLEQAVPGNRALADRIFGQRYGSGPTAK